MGYTTKFKGEFVIKPHPSAEFIEEINLFSSKRHDEKRYPRIWCQWLWILVEKKFKKYYKVIHECVDTTCGTTYNINRRH